MAEPIHVSPEQVRRYRLAAHHLDRPYPADQLLPVAGVCGLQNSPPGAWETALFARLQNGTRPLLHRALEEEKTLLQAWSYRGAPVIFPTAESPVFLSALVARPGEEPWIYTRGIALALDFLGMSWEEAFALVKQALTLLDSRTIQRKEELDRVLAEQAAKQLPPGVRARWNAPSMYGSPDRQTVGGAVVSFALRPCACLGQVVFGRRQGIHPTFTSYARWTGHPLPADPAADAKLVRAFLRAYGPANRSDLAAWLGSSPRQTKRLWQTVEEELIPVEKGGRRAYIPEDRLPALLGASLPENPWILLGAHDPYLDARDRALLLADPAKQRQVWRTVGNPCVILHEGQVAGLWRPVAVRTRLDVTLIPFAPLPPKAVADLTRQAEAYVVFRGLTPGRCTVKET